MNEKNGLFWYLFLVYGHLVNCYRMKFWELIANTITESGAPVLMAGEFNQILGPQDKQLNSITKSLGAKAFSQLIFNMEMRN